MPQLIATCFWILVTAVLVRDNRSREGTSRALWIPTLWAVILLSRPLSTWVGFGGGGGGVDSQEGSPLDRLFFLSLIAAAIMVLVRRRLAWGPVLAQNWPLLLLYTYFLVSVLWADSSVVSFKRWLKDVGNVFVALVALTEANPMMAIRTVFVRCAYVLIPLSLIFIRYFPHLGRSYSRHSGGMEAVGVTFQKNSLGALVLVAGLVVVWDLIERHRSGTLGTSLLDRYAPAITLAIGAYLLLLCDSKTSMLCLALGSGVLLSISSPTLRARVSNLGSYSIVAAVIFLALDAIFGISSAIVGAMGRDMTFTGRTEVWAVILSLGTDPLFGAGFCSFWSDPRYLSQLPDWVAFSAHNGYLEAYIDGGLIGVALLGLMLLVHGVRTNQQLRAPGNLAVVRFAVLIVTLIGNFSESHFLRMSPLWFLFLVTAVEHTIATADARSARLGRGPTKDRRPRWVRAPVEPGRGTLAAGRGT
jgi:exopolysaccharide production protein ExoQ